MPFQPIVSQRLYQQVANQIGDLIRAGEFVAGQRLPPERDPVSNWRCSSSAQLNTYCCQSGPAALPWGHDPVSSSEPVTPIVITSYSIHYTKLYDRKILRSLQEVVR